MSVRRGGLNLAQADTTEETVAGAERGSRLAFSAVSTRLGRASLSLQPSISDQIGVRLVERSGGQV